VDDAACRSFWPGLHGLSLPRDPLRPVAQAPGVAAPAIDRPPLGALLAALAIRTIRLLAELDLGKRLARREQIQTYLVETWGE
jgi:hypothetical protein